MISEKSKKNVTHLELSIRFMVASRSMVHFEELMKYAITWVTLYLNSCPTMKWYWRRSTSNMEWNDTTDSKVTSRRKASLIDPAYVIPLLTTQGTFSCLIMCYQCPTSHLLLCVLQYPSFCHHLEEDSFFLYQSLGLIKLHNSAAFQNEHSAGKGNAINPPTLIYPFKICLFVMIVWLTFTRICNCMLHVLLCHGIIRCPGCSMVQLERL